MASGNWCGQTTWRKRGLKNGDNLALEAGTEKENERENTRNSREWFSSSFCPAPFLKPKLIEKEKELFTRSKTKV